MIRIFRHYIPTPVLVLGAIEALCILFSAELAWHLRLFQVGSQAGPITERLPQLLTVVVVTGAVFIAVGMYESEAYKSIRLSMKRLFVALLISALTITLLFFIFPDVALWRSIFVYAFVLMAVIILLVRVAFERLIGDRLKRRVLVLGAGERAARIAALQRRPHAGFTVGTYIRMSPTEQALDHGVDRDSVASLLGLAQHHRAEEIVIAVDERRGSLPVESLLEAKLQGVRVSDLSSFFERETGRVDLEALNPSWLILSDGFWSGRSIAVPTKRLFDILASLTLLIASAPILLVTAILVKLTSPGPVFYRQERVGQYGKCFNVLKFRSMRTDAEKDGTPQWAQKGDPRVTGVGRIIRSTRIDEIPQIFNVLFGDMSFVGPRPERPFFVNQLAEQIPYFRERHVVKPGITGWAQLNYPYGASVDDARMKLEYDLYYVKNYSVFLDIVIILQTFRVVLWQDGVR
jgi:sugar transferase (PEP-CTERM system associated)